MPHICTRCNNVYESGEDILKGCPNCGWKKFMFVKKSPANRDCRGQHEQIISQAMGVRIPPKSADKAILSPERQKPPARISRPDVAPSHIHQHPDGIPSESKPLAKALESVKITAPGTYELNLPSLFERDELIMAVKEGTYFIDLTSAFKKSKKD
jgi:hypothetical protein